MNFVPFYGLNNLSFSLLFPPLLCDRYFFEAARLSHFFTTFIIIILTIITLLLTVIYYSYYYCCSCCLDDSKLNFIKRNMQQRYRRSCTISVAAVTRKIPKSFSSHTKRLIIASYRFICLFLRSFHRHHHHHHHLNLHIVSL